MKEQSKLETTATFNERGEAVTYAIESLNKPFVSKVWFTDRFWQKDDRYEVIVVCTP